MIPLKLMLFIFLFPTTSTLASLIAMPGCKSTCGDLDIPYPFGIGYNCSFDPSFEVICDLIEQDKEKPYLHNYELVSISFNKSQARINVYVARLCNNNDSLAVNIDFDGTPFRVSNTLNKFTLIGCNRRAVLESDYMQIGCLTSCNDSLGKGDKGACNGLGGCCQIPITVGLSFAKISFDLNSRQFPNYGNNTCSYAALNLDTNISLDATVLDKEKMPVVVDWSLPKPFYICSDRSYYVDSNNPPGFICKCSSGFEGNPYLAEGCQDINECENKDSCPKHRKCHNTNGGYYCSCPLGKRPNPDFPKAACQLNAGSFTGLAILVGIGVVVVFFILYRVAFVLKRRYDIKCIYEKRQKNSTRHYEMISQLPISSSHDITRRMTIFGIEELQKATNKFDEALIVGRGGHGIVYKGILFDQRVVAIKRPKINDDDREIGEFLNEVVILCQLNHRNVVSLWGCCLESEVPLLVYEFISNGTLTDHLHVNEILSITWNDRLRIVLEVARALSYLHSTASISVFHRDIKTSNILLTDGLSVKLSDFGASRTVQLEQTGVTTVIQGTYGYLDPEYFYTGRLTEKSDVYSFGVILAEILTRMKPTSVSNVPNIGSLAAYFNKTMEESRLHDILDPQLLDEEDVAELESVGIVAEMCLKLKGEERPTMKEVEMRLDILWRSKHQSVRLWNRQSSMEQQHSLLRNQHIEDHMKGTCSSEDQIVLSH